MRAVTVHCVCACVCVCVGGMGGDSLLSAASVFVCIFGLACVRLWECNEQFTTQPSILPHDTCQSNAGRIARKNEAIAITASRLRQQGAIGQKHHVFPQGAVCLLHDWLIFCNQAFEMLSVQRDNTKSSCLIKESLGCEEIAVCIAQCGP